MGNGVWNTSAVVELSVKCEVAEPRTRPQPSNQASKSKPPVILPIIPTIIIPVRKTSEKYIVSVKLVHLSNAQVLNKDL